jgi:hypothetical protein
VRRQAAAVAARRRRFGQWIVFGAGLRVAAAATAAVATVIVLLAGRDVAAVGARRSALNVQFAVAVAAVAAATAGQAATIVVAAAVALRPAKYMGNINIGKIFL